MSSSSTDPTNTTTIQLTETEKAHISGRKHAEHQTPCCIIKRTEAPGKSLVNLDYLNKGAANVVFKIAPRTHTSSTSFLLVHVTQEHGKIRATPVDRQQLAKRVLRVAQGFPKHLTSTEVIRSFEREIRPLFSPGYYETTGIGTVPQSTHASGTTITIPLNHDYTKHLMDHQGVLLAPDVMNHLHENTESDTFNSAINEMSEDTRMNRHWGIILPDMSSTPGQSITLEIKPKWLTQSPNAPRDAIRCRTCAMQVLVPKNRHKYLCPYRLLHGDCTSWVRAMVTREFGKSSSEAVVSSIVKGLNAYLNTGEGHDLLAHIKKLQQTLDPLGVLYRAKIDPTLRNLFDKNLRLAMTLRDCSLFLNISYDKNGFISIMSKLGDLDFKSADKITDWAEKEDELLASGSYTTKDGLDCYLARA
jgi:inositol-pentakisphosphate 2-kinase